MRRTLLALALCSSLVGCGAAHAAQTSAIYTTAVRIARHVCEAVAALPDAPPTIDATSGGAQ